MPTPPPPPKRALSRTSRRLRSGYGLRATGFREESELVDVDVDVDVLLDVVLVLNVVLVAVVSP